MSNRNIRSGRKKIGIVIICLAVFLLILLFVSARRSESELTVTHETINNEKLTESLRIVQLTDLHDAQFGEKNDRLLREVSAKHPDLIVFTGDILDASQKETKIAVDLIRKLCQIAPVYFTDGNHEMMYKETYGIDIDALLEDAGAVVLQDDYADVTVKGQKLRIGGCYGHCYPNTKEYQGDIRSSQLEFMQQMEDTDRLKILLIHSPVTWLRCDTLEYWDYDLVFGGHLHGGQVILPLIGGLYAPDMGFFPGKVSGMFEVTSVSDKRYMILSRGLGSTERIPRINNLPEIMVVDLKP